MIRHVVLTAVAGLLVGALCAWRSPQDDGVSAGEAENAAIGIRLCGATAVGNQIRLHFLVSGPHEDAGEAAHLLVGMASASDEEFIAKWVTTELVSSEASRRAMMRADVVRPSSDNSPPWGDGPPTQTVEYSRTELSSAIAVDLKLSIAEDAALLQSMSLVVIKLDPESCGELASRLMESGFIASRVRFDVSSPVMTRWNADAMRGFK